MTITNQPTGKPKKTPLPTSSTRLPSARERRPALAALAVILIVGGAILAGWLALRQSQTATYTVIAKEVHAGEQITSADLKSVELPDKGVDAVRYDKRAAVLDKYAQTDLLPGTILIPAMYADVAAEPANSGTIGLNLSGGQFPHTVSVGDTAVIILSPNGSDVTVLKTTAVVRNVDFSESGDSAEIDVTVQSACSTQFAAGSAVGDVALYVVPSGDPAFNCVDPRTTKTGG
jgi:hypothetical protein